MPLSLAKMHRKTDEPCGFEAAGEIGGDPAPASRLTSGRGPEPGRENQRQRTRKDLREAAVRLIRSGPTPNLEEVAAEARVSRATAYRYFPSVEALLLEAMVHVIVPEPAQLFSDESTGDPATRLGLVDEALQDAVLEHEPSVRLMLAYILQQSAAPGKAPLRQGRRRELIAAALESSAGEFAPEALDLLGSAVGLVIGAEGLIVAKDVLGLDDDGARRVKRWAIQALVEAARRHPAPDA